jgi:hypothetical protein
MGMKENGTLGRQISRKWRGKGKRRRVGEGGYGGRG